MSGAVRRVVGAAVAVVVVGLVAAAGRAPWSAGEAERRVLRLSWRMAAPRVEVCREPSAEELEELPVHMRREEVCEGRVLPYRLRVVVDGEVRAEEELRPAGAREDRPLYVFHELDLRPGSRRIAVSFERDTLPDDLPGGSADERSPPRRLDFRRTLRLEAGEVALVTYRPDRGRLVLLHPDDP